MCPQSKLLFSMKTSPQSNNFTKLTISGMVFINKFIPTKITPHTNKHRTGQYNHPLAQGRKTRKEATFCASLSHGGHMAVVL